MQAVLLGQVGDRNQQLGYFVSENRMGHISEFHSWRPAGERASREAHRILVGEHSLVNRIVGVFGHGIFGCIHRVPPLSFSCQLLRGECVEPAKIVGQRQIAGFRDSLHLSLLRSTHPDLDGAFLGQG